MTDKLDVIGRCGWSVTDRPVEQRLAPETVPRQLSRSRVLVHYVAGEISLWAEFFESTGWALSVKVTALVLTFEWLVISVGHWLWPRGRVIVVEPFRIHVADEVLNDPATALKRMTKDPTNKTSPHRRVREHQSATNTNGKVHSRVSPALRPTLTRYIRSGTSHCPTGSRRQFAISSDLRS